MRLAEIKYTSPGELTMFNLNIPKLSDRQFWRPFPFQRSLTLFNISTNYYKPPGGKKKKQKRDL